MWRIGARERTKARTQPAKEGVLDSEYGGAPRRELRRRCFKRIAVPCIRRGERLQTRLMRPKGQFLRMLWRVRKSRSNCGVMPLYLAARTTCILRVATATDHPAAAGRLHSRLFAKETSKCGYRCPEDRNHQHQQRAFSAQSHDVQIQCLNCNHTTPGLSPQ